VPAYIEYGTRPYQASRRARITRDPENLRPNGGVDGQYLFLLAGCIEHGCMVAWMAQGYVQKVTRVSFVRRA
jgi:hypothetical protein